jgi:predicted nuclease of predicted toxin-antitoxin system
MRVLLDECLPRRLKKHLPGHNVRTVPEAGWAGTKNGALLRAATGQVDVFITIDSNLENQQHLDALPFAVIILVARTNRLSDLLPLVPDICSALDSAVPGRVIRVGG